MKHTNKIEMTPEELEEYFQNRTEREDLIERRKGKKWWTFWLMIATTFAAAYVGAPPFAIGFAIAGAVAAMLGWF